MRTIQTLNSKAKLPLPFHSDELFWYKVSITLKFTAIAISQRFQEKDILIVLYGLWVQKTF